MTSEDAAFLEEAKIYCVRQRDAGVAMRLRFTARETITWREASRLYKLAYPDNTDGIAIIDHAHVVDDDGHVASMGYMIDLPGEPWRFDDDSEVIAEPGEVVSLDGYRYSLEDVMKYWPRRAS